MFSVIFGGPTDRPTDRLTDLGIKAPSRSLKNSQSNYLYLKIVSTGYQCIKTVSLTTNIWKLHKILKNANLSSLILGNTQAVIRNKDQAGFLAMWCSFYNSVHKLEIHSLTTLVTHCLIFKLYISKYEEDLNKHKICAYINN